MHCAASLLLIGAVLGSRAPDGALAVSPTGGGEGLAEQAAAATLEPALDWTPAEDAAAELPPSRGPGDPLYERLFSEKDAPSAATSTPPTLPVWIWVASAGGLAGFYLWNKRRTTDARAVQVEVLGHTRVGPKARLTVVRVPGEDGRMRRLLVSTGEGSPALLADLGVEVQAAATQDPTAAAPGASFGRALTEEVAAADDDVQEAPEEETEGEAHGSPGFVPPPRVPVWNETPSEYQAATRVNEAGPQTPAPAAPSDERSRTILDGLDALIGDDEAPEVALDVHWDEDGGWRGIPEEDLVGAAPCTGRGIPVPVQEHAEAEEEEPVEVAPSHAAFQALLTGPRHPRRDVRADARIVRPMRPWQAAPVRRTPYDAVPRPPVAASSAAPEAKQAPRSNSEVRDLVAEVLRERTAAAPKAGRVVELARWMRREVGR